MCGVCGIFDLRGEAADAGLVRKMAAALLHRGPDGDGFHVRGRIALGHRRLSIIDLDGGAQPIANEDDSVHIVFNGEIYNFIELRDELARKGHRFKTRSDTEVIVHAYEEWGTDCVQRLNGMFAFALWDEPRQQLLLARDHLGIKPLYYTQVGQRLLFASEIKALLEDPNCRRAVNLPALSQLFTLRFVASPATLFDGISKLPPGHCLVANADGIAVHRFWNWKPTRFSSASQADLVEQYRSLVEDAVRLQMRSDVPVGLFLSSGVDSAALLALMSQHAGAPVHTFTVGFEDGEKSNETDDARALSNRFGARHDELIVGAQDYLRYFDRHLWDIEEPLGNETAAAFYFVSQLASQRVKVALTGQGADEPWAGYQRYVGIKLSQLYSRLPVALTEHVVRPFVERTSSNERIRRGVAALSERDVLRRIVNVYSFFTADMKAKLFQPWLRESVSTDGREAREALRALQQDVAGLDPLSQMLYVDTRANLPDDLLMVGDKTAMAHSLEARVPYLDHRIVEFVESLPPQLKLNGFNGKFLHKKALEKWVPAQTVHQKKKGFDNPIDRWLRTHMKAFAADCLLSQDSAVGRYFDRGYVRELLALHESGKRNHLRHLYLLITFELWHRRFIGA
jgi:asparagine synthase (glutamine-hydrolysing)